MALIDASTMQEQYPQAWAYLRGNEEALRCRESRNFDDQEWYRFGRNQSLDKQDKPKLLVPRLLLNLECAPDPKGRLALDNVDVGGVIPAAEIDTWFLAAILNGSVANWVWRLTSKPFQNDYRSANKQFIAPLPVPRADAATRARIGRLARINRALHTRRARAEAALQRRLESCTSRSEKPEWLLAGQVTPLTELARQAPPGGRASARNAWAKAKQEPQIEAALDRAAILLSPGAALSCALHDGELSLRASGMPVFDRIFVDSQSGAFLLLQWQLALRGRVFIGRAGANALFDALRQIRHSDNPALRNQAIEAGRRLFAYDGMIAKNEERLQKALFEAYGLTAKEKKIILGKAA
jgi:hypothetical protein